MTNHKHRPLTNGVQRATLQSNDASNGRSKRKNGDSEENALFGPPDPGGEEPGRKSNGGHDNFDNHVANTWEEEQIADVTCDDEVVLLEEYDPVK